MKTDNFGVVISLTLFILACQSLAPTCKDEKGDTVDWFVVYKIPILENSSQPRLKSGYAYAFITNNTVDDAEWTLSEKLIKDNDSIFGRTLVPLYKALKKSKKSDGLSYILYNDEAPELSRCSRRVSCKASSGKAHAKGVIALDTEQSGFWMIHSVPRFPPQLNRTYSYATSGKKNGQVALCITIKNDNNNLNNLAKQLLVMRPAFYDKHIDSALIRESPDWSALDNSKWTKEPSSTLTIRSSKNVEFKSFSKSKTFDKDLYTDLIAPNLEINLLVQTWRNGKGDPLDSNCTFKYQVVNINDIRLFYGSNSAENDDWKSTEDHSKWSVADNTNKDFYSCISDINRMRSQFDRGGGAVCLKSKGLWNSFKKSIAGMDGCKKAIK